MLISCKVIMQLIWAYDLAYTKSGFSHDMAQISQVIRKSDLCHMSLVMRKPAFCICENKDADQLRGNREADQRLCFFARYIEQSLFYLNPKFQASSHLLWLYRPVCVGPGRKPRRPVFSQRGSYVNKDNLHHSLLLGCLNLYNLWLFAVYIEYYSSNNTQVELNINSQSLKG